MHLASIFTVENLSQCHLTWGRFDFDDICLHFATAKLGHLSMAFPQFPLFFPETLRPSYIIMLFTATASIPSAPTSSWQFLSL